MPPPKPNICCAGCSKKITGREFLTCSLCNGVYDIECVNYSNKLFSIMDKEKKDRWQCPACKRKQKKMDNSNTPVGHRMHLNPGASGGDVGFSDESNVTLRRPLAESQQQCSPDEASSPVDDPLLATIRREIQLSVAQSVESTVKKYFSKEFSEIKSELAALRELRNSMEFLSEDYDRIKSDLKESQEKVGFLSKENSSLTSKVTDLTNRLNLIEQHSREMNIEINGVPESKTENLLSVTRQLCTVVSVPLQDTDVLTGTRVRKINENNDRPRTIVIKLQTTKKRDEILAAVSRFNKINQKDKLNTSVLGYGGKKSPVYVSEHLSPYNKALHASARKAAHDRGYKYVWIRNGRIFVRKDDNAPAKLIKCHDTLTNL